MVQDGIPELTLERYRAAVRVQYAAGDFRTPCAARLALLRAAGLDKLPGHEREWRDFWEREERAIEQEVPRAVGP